MPEDRREAIVVGMGTLIIALTSLAIALAYEVPAYLCRFLPSGIRRQRVADIALRAMNRFVSCAKAYIGLRLLYDRPSFVMPDRCIVVSNHQSLLDIPILMHYFEPDRRLLFVAKKELGNGIPLISSVLRVGGHALIDRGSNPTRSMRGLGAFARRCQDIGFWPSIFPEGTRSKDGKMGRFHSAGLRRIMDTAPAPLLVVAIDGGWKATKLKTLLSGKAPVEYRVKVLSIVEARADKQGVVDALGVARADIERQLETWRSGDLSAAART
ncbi:MAG: 1-acyl-sn-glycerol-3-phosphate acyltransferase [Spirochaetae bacterium HGW-Spirochaetae-3]|nr:MAG: 1-acyl-sn-glycerol-3-phosphate acyltransferase [Spirochaetae bacterium HGW-Spirochaetae-3]